MLTGLLFGFAPALHVSRADVQDAMKETGRGSTGGLRRSRLRHGLIIAEVALSVVLLAGAGLLFRSFLHLQAVDAGFSAHQVLTARLSPTGTNFSEDADFVNFYDKVLQRLNAVPGVQYSGAINTLPLSKGPTTSFRIEGRPVQTRDNWARTNFRSVTNDYFHAMSIPLLQGRSFSAQDNQTTPFVTVINELVAQREFPGENPIGKRITFGRVDSRQQPVWFEIVGIAASIRSAELREDPESELYFSANQNPFESMSLVIRSSVEPASLSASVRQIVNEVDKSVPVSDVKTMDHIVSESVTQPRFNLFLLGLFSGLALVLSVAGIYGVTAYTVTQRTHELGIRIALGAQVGDVLRMIMGQGMTVIGIGIAIGLAAAFLLMRFMNSLLFGVSATDPFTFAGITAVLIAAGLLACYVPARRATKVDPLIALRSE